MGCFHFAQLKGIPWGIRGPDRARPSHRFGGYGAMAARRIPDPKVGGSNPSSLILLIGAFLAQMVERWPFKPMVVGSIPTEGASQICRHSIVVIAPAS